MPWGTVTRTQMGGRGSSRFDAEAFDQTDVAHEAKLRDQFTARTLGSIVGDRTIQIVRKSDDPAEVDYLSISSVDAQDGALFADSVPRPQLPSRAKWLVRPGDVLISQVRPERGAIGLVTDDLRDSVASSGFYAFPSADLEPGERASVFLYLRTQSARRQLVRRNRNSMYPAVLGQDVENIVIPSFSDADKSAALSAVEGMETARRGMLETRLATRRLFDALLATTGAPPSPFESRKPVDSTVINRSAAFGGGAAARIDAEFFRSEYDDYSTAVSSQPHFKLGEHFDLFAGTWTAGDSPTPIFKQSLLTNYGPNFSAVEVEGAKRGRGTATKEGDILLASTAHEIAYVGRKVDLVRELPARLANNQTVAELMIIRPKATSSPVSASYVVDFLRHEAGRHQVQRCIRGLRGGHTYARDLKEFVLVPRPDRDWLESYEELAAATDAYRAAAITHIRAGVEHMQGRFGA